MSSAEIGRQTRQELADEAGITLAQFHEREGLPPPDQLQEQQRRADLADEKSEREEKSPEVPGGLRIRGGAPPLQNPTTQSGLQTRIQEAEELELMLQNEERALAATQTRLRTKISQGTAWVQKRKSQIRDFRSQFKTALKKVEKSRKHAERLKKKSLKRTATSGDHKSYAAAQRALELHEQNSEDLSLQVDKLDTQISLTEMGLRKDQSEVKLVRSELLDSAETREIIMKDIRDNKKRSRGDLATRAAKRRKGGGDAELAAEYQDILKQRAEAIRKKVEQMKRRKRRQKGRAGITVTPFPERDVGKDPVIRAKLKDYDAYQKTEEAQKEKQERSFERTRQEKIHHIREQYKDRPDEFRQLLGRAAERNVSGWMIEKSNAMAEYEEAQREYTSRRDRWLDSQNKGMRVMPERDNALLRDLIVQGLQQNGFSKRLGKQIRDTIHPYWGSGFPQTELSSADLPDAEAKELKKILLKEEPFNRNDLARFATATDNTKRSWQSFWNNYQQAYLRLTKFAARRNATRKTANELDIMIDLQPLLRRKRRPVDREPERPQAVPKKRRVFTRLDELRQRAKARKGEPKRSPKKKKKRKPRRPAVRSPSPFRPRSPSPAPHLEQEPKRRRRARHQPPTRQAPRPPSPAPYLEPAPKRQRQRRGQPTTMRRGRGPRARRQRERRGGPVHRTRSERRGEY